MSLYRKLDPTDTPGGEAARWLRAGLGGAPLPPLLVVVGLCDGALLGALASSDVRVLALEPDPAMHARCVSQPLVAQWITRGHLLYLTGPDFGGADRAWRVFPPRAEAYKVLTHPRLETRHEQVVRAAQVLKTILFGVRANEDARRKFAPRFLQNVLRNAASIAQGADLRALTDAFAHRPAIVVAAGPSLDRAIESLRSGAYKGLLIAVDTALRPLLHAGIHPHLVVGADPGAANARHFHDLPDCSGTWLVAESGLDPDAVGVFEGRTFWFRISRHHPWPWLNACGVEAAHIEMWGSVLTAAFQVAHLVGANPIAFAGADLAFTNRRPYARGTTYEFDWAEHVAQGLDLASVWESRLMARPGIDAIDVHGRPTPTTASLVAFRDWLVTRIGESGRRVLNASGAGILHGGNIEQGAPVDACGLRDEGAPPADVVSARCRRVDPATLGTFIQHVSALGQMLGGAEPQGPVRDWMDFTDGRVTHAALAACLDDTRQRVAKSGVVASAAPSLFAEALRDRVSVLPEATARLRRRSLSEPEVSRPVSDTVDQLLDDAISILAAAQRDRGARSLESWQWTHRAVEGLLGLASSETCPSELLAPRTNPQGIHPNQLLTWLTVAAGARPWPAGDARTLQAWCVHLAHADLRVGGVASPASVCLLQRSGTRVEEIDAPGHWTDEELAKVMTGAWASERPCDVALATLEGAEKALTLRLRRPGVVGAGASSEWSFPTRPRVLTHLGAPRGIVAYSGTDGAIYVVPHSSESVRVTAAGAWSTHRRWPRSLIQELPLGDDGAVAWSNGLADWHHPESAYVMYRLSGDDAVVVEELPFRPSVGAWWRGRLYWACLPGGVGAWTGLASWAPGEGTRLEVPDVAIFGIEPRADGLMLHPRALDQTGAFKRERIREGVFWTPGQAPERVDFGPFGATSASATQDGVTVSAYPEADMLHVVGPGAGRHVICYWPHRLAWAGRSLIVSTVDWDLLLFENIATTVGAAAS